MSTGFPGLRSRNVVTAALVLAAFQALVGPSTVSAAAPNSLGLRATYDVTATVRYAAGKLRVRSTATVSNVTAAPVGRLTFNVLPARIGKLALGEVSVAGQPVVAKVSDQSVIVSLPQPLAPGERTVVSIGYSAVFSTVARNERWLFAKIDGIVSAYRWIPWLSRGTRYSRPNFGEPFVTAVSPRVRVSLTSDRRLVYATTGRRSGGSGLTQRFVARNVRDFNFVASPGYKKRTTSWDGIAVTVYYQQLSPDKLLKWTLRSLKRFTNKLGPYPYAELAVAESHRGLAMESPQLIWVPHNAWGRRNLAYATVHEIAHQWFYGVVGNDGADHPFADEGLAEFLTRDLLVAHRASKCALDALDRTVYEYTSDLCYYEVVYVQGDRYLNEYRQRVGDSAFWAGLRDYYQAYSFKLASIRDLLDILDAAAGPAGGGHETRFPRTYQPV